jgi:hypothetical protein
MNVVSLDANLVSKNYAFEPVDAAWIFICPNNFEVRVKIVFVPLTFN